MTQITDNQQLTDWRVAERRDLAINIGPRLAQFVRGNGAYVWDDEGKEYLDFLSGIAVNALGHAHPVFVQAVSEQAATLSQVSNWFTTPQQLQLASTIKRIAHIPEGGRVYFCNSGTEAIEAAFKLARLHGGPERPRMIALDGAFHGRTMGALALTAKRAMKDDFEPLPGGVEHITPTIEALQTAMGDDVAAVFLEPIQGEAGVQPLSDEFLQAVRELTTQHGALMIVDEIQTGIGRTGAWFGYESSGVTPDAMTLAKGLGGGFPIGALVMWPSCSALLSPGTHGSTFGGNPLATAVAEAVVGEVERSGLVENAGQRGAELAEGVLGLQHPLVKSVRGRGLLLGIALNQTVANAVRDAAQEAGLIVNAANDSTIRIAPPLNIDQDEIAVFLERFQQALDAVAASSGGDA